jgi:hypothetical protein
MSRRRRLSVLTSTSSRWRTAVANFTWPSCTERPRRRAGPPS